MPKERKQRKINIVNGNPITKIARKPIFAKDLEMNEEETKLIGSHNRGSLRHVFYKVRSEVRKLLGSDRVGLPQTCRYDSFNYSKNFDDGSKTQL